MNIGEALALQERDEARIALIAARADLERLRGLVREYFAANDEYYKLPPLPLTINNEIPIAQQENRLADAEAALRAAVAPAPDEAAYMTGHATDCMFATPLPTGDGYWGCDCGYTNWLIDHEHAPDAPHD